MLFLLPGVPDPPRGAAQARDLGLVSLARQRHAVDAIAFGRADAAPRLASLAERTAVVPSASADGQRGRGLERALRGLLPTPRLVLRHPTFDATVRRFLAERPYDLVQAQGFEMAPYLVAAWAAGGRTAYAPHSPAFLAQRHPGEPSPLALTAVQAAGVRRLEAQVVRRADMTLAASIHDANQLEALAGGPANVQVVPSGLELERYPLRSDPPEQPPAGLFLGRLDDPSNALAVRGLLGTVLPRVFRAVPDCRLYVVGANPPTWLVRAGQQDPRIAVVGDVADERPYFERATALLLASPAGGAATLNALAAMAVGLPVVASREAMVGLDAPAGQGVLLADGADAWVRCLAEVLGGRRPLDEQAAQARALVEQRYAWPVIAPALWRAYDRLEREVPS